MIRNKLTLTKALSRCVFHLINHKCISIRKSNKGKHEKQQYGKLNFTSRQAYNREGLISKGAHNRNIFCAYRLMGEGEGLLTGILRYHQNVHL